MKHYRGEVPNQGHKGKSPRLRRESFSSGDRETLLFDYEEWDSDFPDVTDFTRDTRLDLFDIEIV